MSFRLAIPRRVVLQHCPLPLRLPNLILRYSLSFRSAFIHQTVSSALTTCLSPGDHRKACLSPVTDPQAFLLRQSSHQADYDVLEGSAGVEIFLLIAPPIHTISGELIQMV